MAQLKVDGGKCVHGLSAVARCHACADACPCQAWQITAQGMELDPDKCDGCGLCLAACPTAALEMEPGQALPPVIKGNWCLICEKSTAQAEGAMPCIHAINEAQLLQAYQKGARRLACYTGDCDSCYRGMAHRLNSRLEKVNQALCSRASEPMVLVKAGEEEASINASPSLRRGFFQRLLQSAFFAGQPEAAASGRRQALISLDKLGEGSGLWSMELNAQRCNGCSVCIKLCPEQALNWHQVENWLVLHLDPAKCVGCQLCADVCDRHALQPQNTQPPRPSSALFMTVLCSRCGVGFQIPLHEARQQVAQAGVHFCPTCRQRVPRPHRYAVVD